MNKLQWKGTDKWSVFSRIDDKLTGYKGKGMLFGVVTVGVSG